MPSTRYQHFRARTALIQCETIMSYHRSCSRHTSRAVALEGAYWNWQVSALIWEFLINRHLLPTPHHAVFSTRSDCPRPTRSISYPNSCPTSYLAAVAATVADVAAAARDSLEREWCTLKCSWINSFKFKASCRAQSIVSWWGCLGRSEGVFIPPLLIYFIR